MTRMIKSTYRSIATRSDATIPKLKNGGDYKSVADQFELSFDSGDKVNSNTCMKFRIVVVDLDK